MRKGIVKKLITALLCMTLLFTAVACGDSGNGGGGNGGGTGDGGNGGGNATSTSTLGDVVTSTVNEVKEAITGPAPMNIYKVGSDTIAVIVRCDECKDVMPKGEYEDSDKRLNIYSVDYNSQIDMASTYATFWWHEGDDYKTVWSGMEQTVAKEKMYMTIVSSPGICDKMKFEGEILLQLKDNSGEPKEISRVDSSTAVKSVSLEEFADVAVKALEVEKPKCNWAGVFKTDSYGDVKGVLESNVTDNGAIILNFKFADGEQTYIGYEYLPEDWGEDEYYLRRQLKLLNPPASEENVSRRVDIHYYQELDPDYTDNEGISWSYDEWRDGNGDYKSSTFYRFQEMFTAPAGYVDEDPTGLVLKKDSDDDQYFKPATDDYVINIDRNCSVGPEGQYKCNCYSLHSFDINGFLVGRQLRKYVFENEADAKGYHGYYSEDNGTYFDVILSGNVVYVKEKESEEVYRDGYSSKGSYLRGAYVNCHYYLGWKDQDGLPGTITYASKPYTENEFKMSLDDTVFWDSVPHGYHYSLERKDVYLYTDVDRNYQQFGFSGYGSVDDDGHRFISFSEMHLVGRTLVGAYLDRQWDNELGKSVYYLSFTEITFDEKEANATQYWFKLDDPFDTSINFDTFKTKAPDLILTQKYDMTRAESNY